MTTNQFGLNRHIPEAIRSEVRVRCGFGCAICGVTITEYEHFYPDFAQAKAHDANSIVLICPTHHGLVTKGVIPKEQVEYASKNPAAKQAGYSKYEHPWFAGIPSLKLGRGLMQRTPIPIQVRGESLLQFDPPEVGSNVARISASLRDATGAQFLRVVENEWQVIDGNWDFQHIGKRYIFKDAFGTPMLVLRMEAPNCIAIELLRTSVDGMPIHITDEKITIGTNSIGSISTDNSPIGICFD
jgi:hypothetical protein